MQSDQDVLAGQASEQLPAGSMAGPRLPSGASGMVHVEEQRDHTPSMAASTRLAPGYSAGDANLRHSHTVMPSLMKAMLLLCTYP